MRVIEPYQLRSAKKPKAKRLVRRWLPLLLAVSLVIISSLAIWAYNLPIPKVSAQVTSIDSKGSPVNLSWPSYGQAAIGAVGYDLLESTPEQKAVPTASIAKIMTALAVLKVRPIGINQQGPTITLSEADAQLYDNYLSQNGSVIAVAAGEQISERQALEAMLLPSANNIADSLANWAFGSVNAYSDYTNKLAKELGLTNTTIDSASGFSAQTTSTAGDIVKLGITAMANPVIAQIVSIRQSTVSITGTINNTNLLLGSEGIIGIKTGHTDQAGGCYLFAVKHSYGTNKTIIFVGAVLGADTLSRAMQSSLKLIKQITPNFSLRTVVKKGTVMGRYNLPWGGQATAVSAKDLTAWSWKGSDINAQVYLQDLSAKAKSGSVVGEAQVNKQSVDLILGSNISQPTVSWRLKRWL